uniref:Uncharacterized protein n=1 Tax=Cacopsylla melanoneura TaxID=428564 RepID=A0A8D9BEW7_9HEMI
MQFLLSLKNKTRGWVFFTRVSSRDGSHHKYLRRGINNNLYILCNHDHVIILSEVLVVITRQEQYKTKSGNICTFVYNLIIDEYIALVRTRTREYPRQPQH